MIRFGLRLALAGGREAAARLAIMAGAVALGPPQWTVGGAGLRAEHGEPGELAVHGVDPGEGAQQQPHAEPDGAGHDGEAEHGLAPTGHREPHPEADHDAPRAAARACTRPSRTMT